jgi:DNA mismatch repair protein MutS2
VLRLKGHVPLGGVFNILPHVKRAEIGSMLHPDEFVEIASTIRASRILKTFLGELVEEEDVSLPILQEYGENLNPPTELYRIITSAISENGDVLDSASEKLRSLRTQIRSLEGRVREKLENIIRSSSAQKMLSDAIITIRNDRFVIPVKQEYRSHFGGMVHDQSSSGQTLFIEPQSIVQLNNELHQTKMKEQGEIQRILTELSTKTATYSEELKQLVSILRELDFMFTKAKFGASMKATKPMMNNDGVIRLFRARHPFIPIDEVVANDIELGKDFTTIVITGPNTGGKTVTLKTVGLITLMAQAGLQIPAQDGSEVAVFESVFADIGDEQSIEQSLSTFSSHMVNIVEILRHVDSNSLVLFDELGAGTDPQEGAALAMSILDEVHRRGARVIATTHYPELKAYSYNRDGVTNASVEFDIESLSPTYRLLIGVPGRSNAFEISKRLGLSNDIIENAKTHIHVESNKVDNMIASLERSTRLAEKEEEEAKDLLKAAEKLHKDLQKAMIEFYNKKDELYEQARQEAKSIVRNAEREAEEIIRTLRQMQLEKGAEIKEHELIEARKRLEGVVPEAKQDRHPPIKKKVKQDFKPGDEVKVLSFDQKGHLIERVSENEWQVQIGIIKMKVEEDDLELIKSKPKKETQHIASIKGKEYHVGLELDLRGERYEDALVRLEKYIDDALLAGYPRVSIIHGKGTGALRTGVQNYLKNHRQVKSFHFGNANEGGTGVTIVEFK